MSTALIPDIPTEAPDQPLVLTVRAEALPDSPVDTFSRHGKIPGHAQAALNRHFGFVGAGGLGSWTALGLARSGAQSIFIFDMDDVDRTNLPRQFFYAQDLFEPKALRLAENLRAHALGGGSITGIALPFQEAVQRFSLPIDVLIVGVDNNPCRLACAQWARRRGIPAVFTMLSRDGMRMHCFLQGRNPKDACLWCALPNLNPTEAAPCDAGAIITSCFLASAFTVFFAHRAVMGWPAKVKPFNWREADLLGVVPDRTVWIERRRQCPVCRNLG